MRLRNLFFKRRYKYTATICAIAKNEEDYIVEWVCYHLKIGFEKIFIYDNNEQFGKLSSLLHSYIQAGHVTVIDISHEKYFQLKAYEQFAKTYCDHFEWTAFIDIDEFIYLENQLTIIEFLNRFQQANLITLSWLGYGANGQIWHEHNDVIVRFPTPALLEQIEANFSFHVKSIVRLHHVKSFPTPHIPKLLCKQKIAYNALGNKAKIKPSRPYMQPVYETAYIKHYFTKSYEEWLEKVHRGLADQATMTRKIDEFYYLNSEMRVLNLPTTHEELLRLK